MPARFYSNRRFRRNRRTRRGRSTAAVAHKALRLARAANKIELKYHDTTGISVTPDTSTGSVTHLSSVAQGDGSQERIGLAISPTSVELRLNFSKHASATATTIRLVIYQYVLGASTAITDYFSSPAVTNFKANLRQYDTRTLKDMTINLNTDRPEVTRFIRVRMRGIIGYDGSAGADSQKNGLYLIMLSDEATNTPTVTGQARLFYKDQ